MRVLRRPEMWLIFSLGCEAPFVAKEAQTGGQSATAGTSPTEAAGKGAKPQSSAGAGVGGDADEASGGEGPSLGSSAGTTTTGGLNGGAGTSPVLKAGCDDLAPVGVFEDITPAEVKAGIGEQTNNGDRQGGPSAIAVDPVNQGTIYAGTEHQGLWKSTDCGSHWTIIATGKNAAAINRGINWTFALDPEQPRTLYTSSAYGGNGLFKSTDGGVNWLDVWSGDTQPALASAFTYNLVNHVVIDPEDHRHLLLTMHENCLPPHTTSCILESKDAGATWGLHEGLTSWQPDQGPDIHFLTGPTVWLTGSQSNGVWRTPDAGETWEQVELVDAAQGIELVRTRDGTFYMGAANGIWRSPDGAADTWEAVPDSGPFVGGLATDGSNVYASNCGAQDYCEEPRYFVSADGESWKPMAGVPKLSRGGQLRFDAGHRLLISSNLAAGLWRVAVP